MRAFALIVLMMPALLPAQEPAKSLAIANASVQQYEDGSPLPADYAFVPGETVFLSFQVRGYQTSPDEQVRLSYRIEALDSDKIPVVQTESGKLDATVTDMDKDWLPKVRHTVLVPPYAPPGQYRISVWVKDEVSGREATGSVEFKVGGRAVERSDTLTIRNFRFLRNEGDQAPLKPAAYRGGETLWARFDVTGFKIGEANRIQVAYGLSIVAPSGKTMFTEAQAAEEKDAPFYPKRYFAGIVSLNVQPKTTPGEYTLVISVRDEVGGQTYESRQPFRID